MNLPKHFDDLMEKDFTQLFNEDLNEENRTMNLLLKIMVRNMMP